MNVIYANEAAFFDTFYSRFHVKSFFFIFDRFKRLDSLLEGFTNDFRCKIDTYMPNLNVLLYERSKISELWHIIVASIS